MPKRNKTLMITNFIIITPIQMINIKQAKKYIIHQIETRGQINRHAVGQMV